METQEGDISAYIPTNIISITDGQIYLESDLFKNGIRPAITRILRISRRRCRSNTCHEEHCGPLRIEFAQYKELALFPSSAPIWTVYLEPIESRRAYNGSPQAASIQPDAVENQVLILYALNNGHLESIDISRILKFQKDFIKYIDLHAPSIKQEIRRPKSIKELEKKIDAVIAEVKERCQLQLRR